MEAMEEDRVTKIRKLSKNKRIPISKIYHKRLIVGIPEDFRDKIGKYPDYFRLMVEDDGK